MMRRPGVLSNVRFVLCVGAVALCVVLHAATFFTTISPVWVLPAVFFMAGDIVCAKAEQSRSVLTLRTSKLTLLGCGLLIYAVFTFVYFYKTTGGASSVGIIDGQFVSEYKGHVIRTITESEYRMFPSLWTRVMSAWVGMVAVFDMRPNSNPKTA